MHFALAARPRALAMQVTRCPHWSAAAAARLTKSERAWSLRFRHRQRRAEWLAGRLLAKHVLSGGGALDRLGFVDASDLLHVGVDHRIEVLATAGPLGGPPRPYWRGRPIPVSLSLSHAGGWVVAATHRWQLGIDLVQAADPAPSPVHPADATWTAGVSPMHAPFLGALRWAVKEAVLKSGLPGPLSVLDLAHVPIALATSPACVLERWFTGSGWRDLVVQVPLHPDALVCALFQPLPGGAVATVVTASPFRQPVIRGSNMSDVLDRSAVQRPLARALAPASLDGVQAIFAEITRYPAEILEPDADLETDLGIDSVKLGEVMVALRERFALPDPATLQQYLTPGRVRTIAGITEAITEVMRATAAPAPAAAADVVPAAPTAVPRGDMRAEIQRIFAEVTRYPLEILEADADLETDLGIDSVKLGEIFAVLRERYGLPDPAALRDAWPADAMRTIGGIADAIAGLRATPAASAPTVLAMPAVQTAPPRELPFAGKRALVTGSGRGLGKEFVVRLAELGAEVVVNSFHSRAKGEETVEQIRAAGGKAHHIWASVASEAQLHSLYDQVAERFDGKLDFLISNASNGMLAAMADITVEHWEKGFRTNVIGLHVGAMRATEMMKRCGGGRIITLSTPGATRYLPYFGCMGPVKAAVESLTRFLAIELAQHGIRVNCVSAGPVYGELVGKWPDSSTLVPQWEAITAGGRLCQATDVVELAMYLLGDHAVMMNGSVITLDGGQSVRCGG